MSIEQERTAFEAWVTSENEGEYGSQVVLLLQQNASGDYATVRIQGAWDAWQAAIELDRQGRGEPVAEVVSAYGDPEAFGERYLKVLVDVNTMPYGTKFYRHPQPAEPAKSSIKVSYDEKGDCLYVTVDSNEPATANEDERGIIHRHAVSDGRLVGITIAGLIGDYRKAAEPVKGVSDDTDVVRIAGVRMVVNRFPPTGVHSQQDADKADAHPAVAVPVCHKCGTPMVRNPHPDAGKMNRMLEVGCPMECLPCTVLSRHQWAGRAMAAEAELRNAQPDPAMAGDEWLKELEAILFKAAHAFTRHYTPQILEHARLRVQPASTDTAYQAGFDAAIKAVKARIEALENKEGK